jgi:ABC-type polysaccharide/polyol phosphate transport system ATPase subunit
MPAAVVLREVSKTFHVRREPTRTLKQAFVRLGEKRAAVDTFVALDRVSLEVAQGESVGIIGPNGSGKSTLFKLVSRIMRPTSGEVRVHGRISPLIELSSGFHPELTGIENVHLNGAILGLSRRQVDAKLETIRGFADIGDFVYSPVRVYSSGMLARLAFALAINVEAEILLVDEVLSVGDMSFQARCVRELERLRAAGTTVIFVSHDLRSVASICQRVLWLERGRVELVGPPPEVIAAYTRRHQSEPPA